MREATASTSPGRRAASCACASTPSPDSAGGTDSIEKTAKNSKEPEKIEPPKTPDVIFVEKLQSALAKGDLEGAIGHFETIPEELKDNSDMKILQASLLLSANRTKEAAVIASELKAKDPSNKEVLELNAQIALASGDSQAQNAAIKQLLAADPKIDTVLLACTHYPLLEDEIRAALPPHVRLVVQGDIVADKTLDYLKRHVDMEKRLSKGGSVHYLTTDTAEFFKKGAFRFGMDDISAESLTF